MQATNHTPIKIVCGTDTNYVPHLVAMLKSVEKHSYGQTIHIHIICDGVDERLRTAVSKETSRLVLYWYSANDHVALSLSPLLQISRATYLRLIMDEILDVSVTKILYLDIDVIVTGSLRPLWETELDGFLCAAVADPGVDANEFAGRHHLSLRGRYFNAGVILFDLSGIRRQGSLNEALQLLLHDQSQFEYADQDALNVVLWNNWLELDPTWNFQRQFLYDNLKTWSLASKSVDSLPRIIHFTESTKPWKTGEWHPYAWLYWQNLLGSSFSSGVRRVGHISVGEIVKIWMRFVAKRPNLRRR